MTPERRRVRQLLVGGYVLLVTGSAVLVAAGYHRWLVYGASYGIATAALAMLATHLPSSALVPGVRRAFQLTALSVAVFAAGELQPELSYFNDHAPRSYKFSAAVFVVGGAVHAYAYWLWSKESQVEVSAPE